ncbi:MAG: putative DNA modification/repair radical SAM protein [Promethearchaeota archaeon]
MNMIKKLSILGSAAKYDVCAATSLTRKKSCSINPSATGKTLPAGCCHSYTTDGRCISLFKVLMTNKCANDCYYCQNSTSCRFKASKTRFESEEFCNLFMNLYSHNYVEGLFLSSGIDRDADETMASMIEIIEKLRNKFHFEGYIHAKVLPGASYSNIKYLSTLVDRLSLNLEVPHKKYMNELSSTKRFSEELVTRLLWMSSLSKKERIPAGITTQFIVGGNPASDHDYLLASWKLYKKLKLKRVYYSAFHSIKGTILEKNTPESLLREHRLYQADWLIRVYKWDLKRVIPAKNENLPLKIDPKLNFALRFRDEFFPLDINEATFNELLLVPGIGPKSARRIISFRNRISPIKKESTLKLLGVRVKLARFFVKINGRYYSTLDSWMSKISNEKEVIQ